MSDDIHYNKEGLINRTQTKPKESVVTNIEEQIPDMERPTKKPKLDADDCIHWIHQLTCLGLSDFDKFAEIILTIHSLLVQNKGNEDSLRSLCRILTLRLGYLIGSKNPESIAGGISISILCLQHCFQRILIHQPETIITFRTVVQLFDAFVGTTNDFCRNVIGLFQIWFGDNTTYSVWLSNDRSSIEEMTLLLVQAASKKQPSMASCIRDFLGQSQSQQICSVLFDIALQVLRDNHPDKSPQIHEGMDQLFEIQCLTVMEKLKPAEHQLQSMIRLLKAPPTALRAIEVLQKCTHYLTSAQLVESTDIIAEYVMNPECSSCSTLLPAMTCLKELLTRLPSPMPTAQWEELLQCCSPWALDGSTFDYPLQESATSVLLTIIPMGIQNATTTTQKRRLLATLSHLILSCQSKDLLSRAILLACEWIDDKTLRKEILQIHPDLVNSLAHIITLGHVPTSETCSVLQAVSKILHSEPQNNHLTRLPKLLDAIVTLLRSPLDEHRMAMDLLLILSENPCNRRILAKHPGILSSMIHFVRRTTTGMPNQNRRDGDMKKQVLLLAQAL